MPRFLKILAAPAADKIGMKIPLNEGDLLLGRACPPCDMPLESAKVSKKHCIVRVRGDAVTIEDLNSANGIFVNGKRVSMVELHEKDRLVIGEFMMEVTVK